MIKPLDVLVVDDEAYTLEIMDVLMSSLGHRVHTCVNGFEALVYSKNVSNPIDVIVMDIQMPVMDGLEAITALRQIAARTHTPIICVSAKAQSSTQEAGYRAGCDCYLTKPISQDRIFEAITATLVDKGVYATGETFS